MLATREDDKRLPGSKRLIAMVRRELKSCGIVPVNPIWREAWAWAKRIGDSYLFSPETRWPSSNEIATQYVVLLMATMQGERRLKLPFRANRMTDDVRARLSSAKNGRRLAIAEDPEEVVAGSEQQLLTLDV